MLETFNQYVQLQGNEEAGEGVCASGQHSPMRAWLRTSGFMQGQARHSLSRHPVCMGAMMPLNRSMSLVKISAATCRPVVVAPAAMVD